MAKTPSTQSMPLGSVAPAFTLPDTISGKMLALADLQSTKATAILFLCNHCPFVVHIAKKLSEIAQHYTAQGVQFIGICSNDVEHYPADAPALMKKNALEYGYCFPYLYDESQAVARAYDAACTPDLYIFDRGLKCVYRGQFDDSRPGSAAPVTGKDFTNALDAVLAGKPVNASQQPSLGCNIKWKS